MAETRRKKMLVGNANSKWTLCPIEFHYGILLFLCATFRNFLLHIHPQKYTLPNNK